MQTTYHRHLLFTATYSQDGDSLPTGLGASKDFNRYLQRFRRFNKSNVEYLRVLERHKSGVPHIHAILQFPDARICCKANRYFESILYRRWQALWKKGYSDYRPAASIRVGALLYVMKYLVKNTTKNTIWKKILLNNEESRDNSAKEVRKNSHVDEDQTRKDPLPIKINGAKICSWSRGFDFTPFTINPQSTTVSSLLFPPSESKRPHQRPECHPSNT